MAATLVIADDNPDLRALVRVTLGNAFDEVVEVADGRELIWHLLRANMRTHEDRVPDLVVIADVRMPVYDGLEVLSAWEDGEPLVPLVVITSFPTPETLRRANALDAVLVRKPFTQDQLRQAVNEAMARARSRARR